MFCILSSCLCWKGPSLRQDPSEARRETPARMGQGPAGNPRGSGVARAALAQGNTARTGVGVAGRNPNGLRGLFVEREVPHARTGKSDPMQDKSDDPSGTVRHRENTSQIWREGPPSHPAPCPASTRLPFLREERGGDLGYRENTISSASSAWPDRKAYPEKGKKVLARAIPIPMTDMRRLPASVGDLAISGPFFRPIGEGQVSTTDRQNDDARFRTDDDQACGKPSPGPQPCHFQRLPVAILPGILPALFAVGAETGLETDRRPGADEEGGRSALVAKGARLGIDATRPEAPEQRIWPGISCWEAVGERGRGHPRAPYLKRMDCRACLGTLCLAAQASDRSRAREASPPPGPFREPRAITPRDRALPR